MDQPSSPTLNAFLLAVVVEGGLGLIAVGVGSLLDTPPAEKIDWNSHAALVGLAATLPLIAVFWLCVRTPFPPFRRMIELLDEVLVPLFRPCPIWQLAMVSAFAGLGEEMLFRGVIQTAVARQISEPWGLFVGWVVASALFGLLHFVTVTYAILATLIGLYLGWLWIASDNLLVPAVVHALYDFWALVYLIRIRRL